MRAAAPVRAFLIVLTALAAADAATGSASALSGYLADPTFDESVDSAFLRADGAGQDWYESRQDVATLVILDGGTVGGNDTNKAHLAASVAGDAYLSQEFSTPQGETFGVQWDIFVDSVLDIASPDRAGWMLIGDDSDPSLPGPNSNSSELFVAMAFARPGGGSVGQADLVAWDRDDGWSSFTTVASGLSLKQWYTVRVICDVGAGAYDVYVDDVYAATVSSRNEKSEVSHISFAQRSDGAGSFYVDNVHDVTILHDIDSGLTSPTGNYRWRDVADQLYALSYRGSYDYTQAHVDVLYDRVGPALRGTLRAYNLKPNFAYQLKLDGIAGTDANERIGLAGRWWQEEWNGSDWANGQNLNDKGDGSSPNPNDEVYFARRNVADTTSPTGLRYRYSGYLVLDYFVTDENGAAIVPFEADNSFHVLWKSSQRTHTGDDGPLIIHTFDAEPGQSPAYATDYGEQTVEVFGEWERLPTGGIHLDAGGYTGQLILTEESFHGSGGSNSGGWAAAMGAAVAFEIGTPTAVGIEYIRGTCAGSDIVIEWKTASEIGLSGFNLYRSVQSAGTYLQLNEAVIPARTPGAPLGDVYSWLDSSVQPGMTYSYLLEAVQVGGRRSQHGPVSVRAGCAAYLPWVLRS